MGRGLGPRGQTLHDYTVGIGLFVLTVAAVLTVMFGFLSPLAAGVTSEDVSQSERVSEALVSNHSTERQPNQLRASLLASTLGQSPAALKARWGIEDSTNLNVTVETLNGSAIVERAGTDLAAGSPHAEYSTGTAVRVVQFDEPVCDPACRLVVRVW